MSLPIWMCLHIVEKGKSRVRLWIPLILVWILLLPLLVLAAPFVLLAAIVTWRRGPGPRLLLLFPLFFSVIWHLPGLHIEVESPANRILIHLR